MKSEQQRLEEKFSVDEVTGCWNWTAAKSCSHPSKKWFYGHFVKWVDGKPKQVMAHRAAYELYVGEIPKGMCLDHLCRNTLCVNPDHLEVVTYKENIRRGYALKEKVTHCKHGHEYTEENTYFKKRPGGTITRECKICRKKQLEQHFIKKANEWAA